MPADLHNELVLVPSKPSCANKGRAAWRMDTIRSA